MDFGLGVVRGQVSATWSATAEMGAETGGVLARRAARRLSSQVLLPLAPLPPSALQFCPACRVRSRTADDAGGWASRRGPTSPDGSRVYTAHSSDTCRSVAGVRASPLAVQPRTAHDTQLKNILSCVCRRPRSHVQGGRGGTAGHEPPTLSHARALHSSGARVAHRIAAGWFARRTRPGGKTSAQV